MSRSTRDHLPSQPYPQTILTGGVGAGLGVTLVLVSLQIIWPYQLVLVENDPIPVVPFLLYGLVGGFVLGGVLGVLSHRFRTVIPALVASILLVTGDGHAWWRTQVWEPSSGVGEGYPSLDQVTLLDYVFLYWPLILVGLLVIALVEWHVTRR